MSIRFPQNGQGLPVLLVNPPNQPFFSKEILIEPIDLLGIGEDLRTRGVKVSALDMDAQQLRAADLPPLPPIVAIVWDYHIPLHGDSVTEEVTQICKHAAAKGSLVVIGGKPAVYSSEQTLRALGAHVYVGKGMAPAIEALSKGISLEAVPGIKFFKDNQLVCTAPTLEKKTPPPSVTSRDTLLDLNNYIDVRTILTSHGCHQACTFCHVTDFWKGWSARDSKSVITEIHALRDKLGAKKVLLLDDNALTDKKRMHQIAKETEGVALGCLGSADKFDEDLFAKMYKGGFRWIHFGAESGDDNVLKLNGKRVSTSQLKHAVKGAKAIGFRVRTSWILDLPHTSESSLSKTEDLIQELETEEIRLHFLSVRPGSELYKTQATFGTPFIHAPTASAGFVSTEKAHESLERILGTLATKGYNVVRDPSEVANFQHTKDVRVVSVCPLRYGMGWTL